jgi:adenine-specific DNA methylase
MPVSERACPRLIEVALPIRKVSAESVRDKSLRHGHISTLHLWWARRPLAASRAVVFASLVPDPSDPRDITEYEDLTEEERERIDQRIFRQVLTDDPDKVEMPLSGLGLASLV